MDMTARKTALEQAIQQATQQIGSWTEKLIGAKAQLALVIELEGPTLSDPGRPLSTAAGVHQVSRLQSEFPENGTGDQY